MDHWQTGAGLGGRLACPSHLDVKLIQLSERQASGQSRGCLLAPVLADAPWSLKVASSYVYVLFGT